MGPTTRTGTADAAASRAESIQTRLEAGNDCPLDARQLLDEEQGLTGTPKARSTRHTTTTREVCLLIKLACKHCNAVFAEPLCSSIP